MIKMTNDKIAPFIFFFLSFSNYILPLSVSTEAASACASSSFSSGSGSTSAHPLDPLSLSELTLLRSLISSSFPSSAYNFTVHYVGLDEPDKDVLLLWLSNTGRRPPPPPRRALVLARVDGETHEVVVDLTRKRVVSERILDGYGYPILTFEEQTAANNLPLKYGPFIAAMKSRHLKIEEVCFSLQ